MIEHAYKDLFKQDSVNKQILIAFDGGQLTNSEVYSESFELKESLCSESELTFGSCEASEVKFKIANTINSLKDKEIVVSELLNGDIQTPFPIGKYKVFSDVPSGDRNYRNITAYDAMYDIINADVTEWYESLEFPLTQKAFRDSFFAYFGITQEETTLIHDELTIEKTITGTGISGKLIIVCICELNGVFGHINRLGNFVYVSLEAKEKSGLYPSITLYPSTSLFPGYTASETNNSVGEVIDKNTYISCEYEDFKTKLITKLQIRQEENDLGVVAGDGTNAYIIENNFLVYGKLEEELQEIAEKTLNKICDISYKPFKAKLKGNPCFEVGDAIIICAKNGNIESYVLERTLTGIQSLKDTFEAQGAYEYKEKINSLKKDIQQLKGKSNVLERTLESTRSEITDIEAGLNTKIEQNTEKINASVQSIEKNISNSVESLNGDMANLTKKVEATMTSEQVRVEIQKEVEKGSSKVVTSTGVSVTDEGLTVDKSGSEMKTTIYDDGMKVFKNGEPTLVADNVGVEAKNLHATTYLIIGKNSRLEDYKVKRTACFYIGGGS